MNKLSVKILTAVLTFIVGVAVASLWLTRPAEPPITPVNTTAPARLEMVFVLDTTGSMTGLINGAKQKIWGIVNEVMREQHSSVRIGLVAYRDRGDQYLTQVLPLTEDLDQVYTTLMDYQADGGGDGPEDVRTALAEGVHKLNWSTPAADLSQVLFLVGDAPPHDDYNDAVDTLSTATSAVQKGIIVNTIQCGFSGDTTQAWRAIAKAGKGEYFSIASDGGVQAIASPYDEHLDQLARQLGATFVPYGLGTGTEGAARRAEAAATAGKIETRVAVEAPMAAKADRAVNKALNAKAYINDLLQGIENGSLKLEKVDPAQLTEDLRSLSPADREQEIKKRLAVRREIRSQIMSLSKQREAFIDAEKKKKSGERDGFDAAVSKTLKRQLLRK
ncbi:MAG: VWA domain-containing protein [Acidobacteria bacterium]|nr:VWA domain-containing protein [Acidobacteriota bacterium]MCA1627739.1 VWA domain-containing protein [Acidobacteriota bacterium]